MRMFQQINEISEQQINNLFIDSADVNFNQHIHIHIHVHIPYKTECKRQR